MHNLTKFAASAVLIALATLASPGEAKSQSKVAPVRQIELPAAGIEEATVKGRFSQVDLEKRGMVLTPLNTFKLINVEVGPQDFLELKVPLYAYVLKADYKIHDVDYLRLRELANRVERLSAMPLNDLVQNQNSKELGQTARELQAFALELGKRIDPNALQP